MSESPVPLENLQHHDPRPIQDLLDEVFVARSTIAIAVSEGFYEHEPMEETELAFETWHEQLTASISGILDDEPATEGDKGTFMSC